MHSYAMHIAQLTEVYSHNLHNLHNLHNCTIVQEGGWPYAHIHRRKADIGCALATAATDNGEYFLYLVNSQLDSNF